MTKKELAISFIFPVLHGAMGGVQMLFVNLIKYLTDNNIAIVRLYDYRQGFIHTFLQKINVVNYEFYSLNYSEKIIYNKGDEVFIIPSFGLFIYPQLFNVVLNTYILAWDVYYPFWNNFNKIKGIPLPFFKRNTFKLLYQTKGIVFMDSEGREIFKRSNFIFANQHTLYIPISETQNIYYPSTGNVIHIGYMGRAAFWKITPVIYLLKQLSLSSYYYKLTIITDNKIEFGKHLIIPPNVTLIFKENLYEEKLRNTIKCFDLGIGMGTSALDLAKYGVPTLLVDFSNKLFPKNYKFKWLFEREPGTLGIDLSNFSPDYSHEGHTWSDIVEMFIKNKLIISNQCYNFILLNHSIDVTCNKLVELAYKSQLSPIQLRSFYFKLLLFNKKVYTMRKFQRLLEMC